MDARAIQSALAGGVDAIMRALRDGLSGQSAPADNPLAKALRQCAALYGAFIRRRFTRYSRGQGDWAPLAESTVRHKQRKTARLRYNRGKQISQLRVSILIDTGVLRNAFEEGSPAQTTQLIPNGIRWGLGPAAHRGRMTIGRLAWIHHTGAGRVPARPILVAEPDESTKRLMMQAMRRAWEEIRRLAARAGVGGRA